MKSFGSTLEANQGFGRGFDFMRLFLAFSVLAWHTVNTTSSTPDFVDRWPFWLIKDSVLPMFFGLSGFLVAASSQRLSISNFLLNRSLRIVPALAVEITLSALVLGPLFTAMPLEDYFKDPAFFAYFANIFGWIHYRLPGVFLQNYESGIVNASLSTVPFELGCYCVLCLLMILRLQKNAKVALGLATICLALTSAYGIYIAASLTNSAVKRLADLAFTGRGALLLPAFLLGVTAYNLRYKIPMEKWLLCACILVVGITDLFGDQYLWDTPWIAFLICPLFIYIVVFLGLSDLPKVPVLCRGDYSYGIYLYGFPVQQTLSHLMPDIFGPIHFILSSLFVTALAAVSWHLIESPILSLRHYFSFVARHNYIDAKQ